jgi:tetratricopeptide (TPR) repeat protein
VGISIRYRARTALNKGQDQEAITLYQLLVRLNKDDALTHGILSRLFERQGQWEGAITSCREAIRLNKDNAEAAIHLAWLLATCPDPKFRDAAEAVELTRKAVARKTSAAHFRTILGVALYRAGDWKASATALEQSLRLQQGDSVLNWLFLAMAHSQMDHKAEAHKWYDQAIEWMDKNQDSWAQVRDNAVENLGANHQIWPMSQNEYQNDQLARFRAEATEVLKAK